MIGFESHNKLDLQHCKDTFKTNTQFFKWSTGNECTCT